MCPEFNSPENRIPEINPEVSTQTDLYGTELSPTDLQRTEFAEAVTPRLSMGIDPVGLHESRRLSWARFFVGLIVGAGFGASTVYLLDRQQGANRRRRLYADCKRISREWSGLSLRTSRFVGGRLVTMISSISFRLRRGRRAAANRKIARELGRGERPWRPQDAIEVSE